MLIERNKICKLASVKKSLNWVNILAAVILMK